MDMTGERHIPAPRAMVWEALNDPATLKSCIPGCERLEATSPQDLEATAAVKIGPISARFNGKVHLTDIDEPNGYRISGEGQGGVAGFARGGAVVRLADDGTAATLLRYEVQAQVGGKMAQLGARLIDSTSKSLADQFFNNLTSELTRRMAPTYDQSFPSAPGDDLIPVSPAAIPGPSLWSRFPAEPMGFPMVAWIGCALWLVILFLIVAPLI